MLLKASIFKGYPQILELLTLLCTREIIRVMVIL